VEVKYRKLLSNPYMWLFSSWLIILLPLILLGSPGFYNDDFHSYQSLNTLGFSGSIQNWLSEYGSAYRPIGIGISYFYYSLLPQNSFLLYLFYQLIYLLVSFVLFRQIYFLTKDVGAGVFIALFFLFFPFNATAYWQIPSIYMVVAILFSIIVMVNIATLSGSGSRARFILYLIFWALLLLTYEQLLGLAAVLGVLVLFMNYNKDTYKTINKITFPIIAISIVSVLFLVAYFSSEGNPKLVSLKSMNVSDAITQDLSTNFTTIKSDKFTKLVKDENIKSKGIVKTDSLAKIRHFANRIESGVNFLISSVAYALHKLISVGYIGYFMITVIIFFGVLTFFIPPSFLVSTGLNPVFYMIIGFLWISSTLAPFFLYDKVHIPPYTLMLPSIGLGIFLYGLLQYMARIFPKSIFTVSLKYLLILVATLFPLIQYGYYFGLKEELHFWDNVASRIHQGDIEVNENLITINSIPKRGNSHIFWLEKAVGLRYISDLIGEEFNIVGVSHSGKKLILSTTVKSSL
jgi:hypothetical protein